MERIVNVRLSLVCLLGITLGIIAFYEMLFANFWVLISVCFLLIASTVVFACLRKRYWIVCLTILLFVGVGFANLFFNYCQRNEDECFSAQCVVSGRVTDIGRNGNAQNVLYLENCQAEGQSLRGRVKVYVYDGTLFNAGDIVSFSGNLRQVYVVKDDVDTFSVRNKVYYQLSDAVLWQQKEGALTVGESVRKYVYDVTANFMPKCGAIAYALLTGDRNALDGETKSTFLSAGIMHLLVVSGLHVGFVVTVLHFLLKRLRLHLLAELSILLAILLFYAYICDFSPSILRAIAMTVCVYLCRLVHGRYDLLTSLCWAALIILLVQPLYLFDAGFQLSFMSVFGIATIFLQLDRKLAKRRLNKVVKWLVTTVAMSFSCIVSTLFVSAYHFGKVAVLGMLFNIVAIPLVFAAFVLCLVGMLPWVFHYVLWLADNILYAVTKIASLAEKLPAYLPLTATVAAIVISVALLFVVGGFVNLTKRSRKISYCLCSVLLVACVLCSIVPTPCNNSVRVFWGYDDAVLVATSDGGEVAVVGNFGDSYASQNAVEFLVGKHTKGVTLYVTEMKSSQVDVIKLFTENFQVEKLYALDSSGSTQTENYLETVGLSVVRAFPNVVLGGEISVQPMYDGGLSAVVVKVGKISVATVLGNTVKTEHFAQLRTDVNYYVVRSAFHTYSNSNLQTISFYQQTSVGNFGANKYGNFTIREKDDKIYLNFRRNLP